MQAVSVSGVEERKSIAQRATAGAGQQLLCLAKMGKQSEKEMEKEQSKKIPRGERQAAGT